MRAVFAIDQLNVDPNLVTDPSHAAFEDVVHPKLVTDLFYVYLFAPVGERGISGDHDTAGKTREIGSHVVGDAIDEIFLLGIVRQVRKGQDNDRQPWSSRRDRGFAGLSCARDGS